jgi:cytochrome c-type biogenesis protein CcmH
MRCVRTALILVSLLAPVDARAVQPDEVLSDPGLEARARTISQDLRCLVCQNQSIDDSAAPLARDLRLLVREQLKAGRTDRQVIDYLVDRYGEFVLLRPKFGGQTALLWLAPFGVLLLGAAGLVAKLWRDQGGPQAERASVDEPELTVEERERLSRLIGP